MYAEMMRRMQQKTVDAKKKADKAAIITAAEAEVIRVMKLDKDTFIILCYRIL